MRLELRDLWAAPPGAPQSVLRGVSLSVTDGEWVAVGGENGCGKSTLLQVAAGLLPPLRGERRLEFDSRGGGRPDSGGRARQAPRVATVLQDPSLQLFAPTVAEEIGLTALHLGESPEWREARVRRWSAILGLDAELSRPPQALSAGRQQLVLLAAALASEPDLLVADEPCAHLDETTRGRVLEVLREEVARGLAIVWATQSSEERAAASRELSLGGEAAEAGVGPRPFRTYRDQDGYREDFLIINVGPDPGTGGPCVRTPHSFGLRLPSRGIVCFAGPNGAGKSVLLASVCGLIRTPQVQISMGESMLPPLFVGQFPETQIFEEDARREMTFAAVSRGVGRSDALRQAEACLVRFRMAGRPDQHSWELSSGERRLVLLIGALIAPASVLTLDEPTAGLDPARKDTLASLVVEASLDRLVLIASQDTVWARKLSAIQVPLPPSPALSSPSKKTD